MNILFIVPYAPTLIRVRPYNLIRFLARHGHRVTLATVWDTLPEFQSLDNLRAHGIEVIATPLNRAQTMWNALRTLPTPIPLQAAYCQTPTLRKAIAAKLEEQAAMGRKQDKAFDVVHVEHLRGAQYGLALKSQISDLRSRIPVVWDSVDCITYLFEQAAQQSQNLSSKLVTRWELGRTRRYEGWLVQQFDQVLVTSETDETALKQISNLGSLNSDCKISVLSNGVDLEYFTPGNDARQVDTLVFSGKMSYHANVTAVLYLVKQVMPLVWAHRPDARLVIAGSQPTSAVRQLALDHPGRVEVTGYIPDLRLPLRRASLAVAPLIYGAGIQNKVLEAMACGTPVVASPLAVSALSKIQPGADCLIGITPQIFAEQVLRLMGDEALRERLGTAGRRYVEAHHNWDDIVAHLETIYQRSIKDVQRTHH
jgi:glycosyltransferase involved in cell wall biosynthesis